MRAPESRLGRRGGQERAVTDLAWPSAFEPQGIARDRFASRVENRTARARLLVHAQPSPAVILVHGFGGGSFGFEERALSARFFFDQNLDSTGSRAGTSCSSAGGRRLQRPRASC